MTTTDTPTRMFWNVMFSHRNAHVTITVTVPALNADDAMVLAENLICDLYDLDVSKWWCEADDTTEPAGDDA